MSLIMASVSKAETEAAKRSMQKIAIISLDPPIEFVCSVLSQSPSRQRLIIAAQSALDKAARVFCKSTPRFS